MIIKMTIVRSTILISMGAMTLVVGGVARAITLSADAGTGIERQKVPQVGQRDEDEDSTTMKMYSKMTARPIDEGGDFHQARALKRAHRRQLAEGEGSSPSPPQQPQQLRSNYAMYIGSCSTTTSGSDDSSSVFEFPLSAGSGRGMAILMGDEEGGDNDSSTILQNNPVDVELEQEAFDKSAQLTVDQTMHADPLRLGFSFGDWTSSAAGAAGSAFTNNTSNTSNMASSLGSLFYYNNIAAEGSTAFVKCPTNPSSFADTEVVFDILVLVRDNSNAMIEADLYGDNTIGAGAGDLHVRLKSHNDVNADSSASTQLQPKKGSTLKAQIPSPKAGHNRRERHTRERRRRMSGVIESESGGSSQSQSLSISDTSATSIRISTLSSGDGASVLNGGSTSPSSLRRLLEETVAVEVSSEAQSQQVDSESLPVLIQVELEGPQGESIYRTLMADATVASQSRLSTPILSDVTIEPLELTEVEDVLIIVTGLETLHVDTVHLTIEVGLAVYPTEASGEGEPTNGNHGQDYAETTTTTSILDLSAIVHVDDAQLILHGGWIRRSLHELKLERKDWDLVVVSVEATHVDDPAIVLAYSPEIQNPGFSNTMVKDTFLEESDGCDDGSDGDFERKRRRQLRRPPTTSMNAVTQAHRERALEALSRSPSDEERSITEDMRQGRRPAAFEGETLERRQRRLTNKGDNSVNRAKILVHGYCSSASPFPPEHFTNALHFSDPDGNSNSIKSNWSNDEFARKIRRFALANDLESCGCLGHSQGGLACLHLHANYWSCLDNASSSTNEGTRLLQSIGTPYLGTHLAGEPAEVAGVFGYGCNTNYALTYSGAQANVRKISSNIQSKMHYYTTSFEDASLWLRDYCHAFTDMLLDDPDDGVTEQWSGQLLYGTNAGHTTGQCHSSNMRDEAQAQNAQRNAEMNANAMF
jgi:hypothetical protein